MLKKNEFLKEEKFTLSTLREARREQEMLKFQLNGSFGGVAKEMNEEVIQRELLEMKLEEQRAMKEIQSLKMTLNQLEASKYDTAKNFQSQTNTLLDLNQLLRDKEEEFLRIKSSFEDDKEIREVLMMRIKGKKFLNSNIN